MAFTPKQSKANQIWFTTLLLVILALAVETQPHAKAPAKALEQAEATEAATKEAQKDTAVQR